MESHEYSHRTPLAETEPVGWGWRGFLLGLWLVGSFGGMYFVRQLERITVLGWPLLWMLWRQVNTLTGPALNKTLGMTGRVSVAASVLFTIALVLS